MLDDWSLQFHFIDWHEHELCYMWRCFLYEKRWHSHFHIFEESRAFSFRCFYSNWPLISSSCLEMFRNVQSFGNYAILLTLIVLSFQAQASDLCKLLAIIELFDDMMIVLSQMWTNVRWIMADVITSVWTPWAHSTAAATMATCSKTTQRLNAKVS